MGNGIFKKFCVIFMIPAVLLCGCNAKENATSEANGEVYREFVTLIDGQAKEEQYAEYLQETLQNAFLELDGVEDAAVTISYTADSVEADVDLTYAESAEQEKIKENVESAMKQFFSDCEEVEISVN